MNIPSAPSAPDPGALDGYVLAASVVDTFQPDLLEPVQGYEADLGHLLDVSVMTERADGAVEWRLPNGMRRDALRTLAEQNLLDTTLEANRAAAPPDSAYQAVFEQYLRGNPTPVTEQDVEHLQASLNALRVLDGVLGELPDAEQVRSALVRRDFVNQFELLAGEHFVGRETPLAELRRFVDVLPEGLLDRARQGSAAVLGRLGIHSLLHEVPMVITGMGGMGKSALLSHFLLEHLRAARKRPDLLFAYVDFDRPAIWPDQPLTVLAEIARQLALQLPGHARRFLQLAEQVSNALADNTAYGNDYDSPEALLSHGTANEALSKQMLARFGTLCRDALAQTSRKTLLLVCDTFEEVTQRSVHHQTRLLTFVGELQRVLPRLRVVVSGRGMHPDETRHARSDALIDELVKAVRPLELQELSPDESTELLQALGSPNPRTNRAIVRRVGGHPLSLKLAAQLVGTVAERLGRAPGDLTASDLFGKEWQERLTEGMLYRRLIDHLPNEPLQKLAHPGLVLREVTAEILRDVLNEPCKLGLHTRADADRLFERLQQFNQLVSVQSSGALRHRPEVRQRVLKDMVREHPTLCREIWTRAAEHYQRKNQNRAEELYCRLMLDEPVATLSERWQTGLEATLLRSRQEMPARARQFIDLMALVGGGGSTAELDDRDLDRSLLAEEMKLLLSRGNAVGALDLFRATLSGTTPRFDSALFAVHVRAIAQSGDLERAIDMAWDALHRLDDAGKAGGPRFEELLLLCCQITRAQHAANSGSWRHALRGVLRRTKPRRVREWCRLFAKVDPEAGRPLHMLRIAVALLELFQVENGDLLEPRPGQGEDLHRCVERARTALSALAPLYDGVDGGLLVRSLAVLSAFPEATRELLPLLELPLVARTLRRSYGDDLAAVGVTWTDAFGSKERPVEDADRRRPDTLRFKLNTLRVDGLGMALRPIIRARDDAQGTRFL